MQAAFARGRICFLHVDQPLYHPRFVLDGIRSLFRLVALNRAFMFKTNSLCKSEILLPFFILCRQDHKGPAWADKHTYVNDVEKRARGCTLRGVLLMCGFDGGTDCKIKEGEHIHD